jgi:hypothetical protein
MKHDERCERRPEWNTCNCATRAYRRDPMLDEDGQPIPLQTPYGTMAPWVAISQTQPG